MNNKNYVVSYKGKDVSLFDEEGKIIRKFKARAEVVNAQINRANNVSIVAISTKDGKFELYRSDGTVIRRS